MWCSHPPVGALPIASHAEWTLPDARRHIAWRPTWSGPWHVEARAAIGRGNRAAPLCGGADAGTARYPFQIIPIGLQEGLISIMKRYSVRSLITNAVCFSMMFSVSALANCDTIISIGSTLIAKPEITGWMENREEHDGYEGCRFGRILVFQDRTGVQCSGYNYQYSYRPQATLWSGPDGLHLCIESEWIQVQQLR